ncbi:MAG: hypothetical protein HY898_06360 [Deltaproteobacteria bacterium]|nr:hypothetical protein [Deltaproteobacteria bacterium]
MRMFLGVLVGLAALTAASSAMALDEFGSGGQFAVGIERAFGAYHYSMSDRWERAIGNNVGVYEDTYSGTQWNLLLGRSSDTTIANSLIIPRVGFDYFVANHWSVGGAIGYVTSSGERTEETRPPGQNLQLHYVPDTSGFLFAPRAGFAYMFTKVVGIWPRAGITYMHGSSDLSTPGAHTETSINLWDLDLECHLVITPVDHVAITVGPVVDIGIAGGYEVKQTPIPNNPEPDHDNKLTNYGVAAGLLAYF